MNFATWLYNQPNQSVAGGYASKNGGPPSQQDREGAGVIDVYIYLLVYLEEIVGSCR